MGLDAQQRSETIQVKSALFLFGDVLRGYARLLAVEDGSVFARCGGCKRSLGGEGTGTCLRGGRAGRAHVSLWGAVALALGSGDFIRL